MRTDPRTVRQAARHRPPVAQSIRAGLRRQLWAARRRPGCGRGGARVRGAFAACKSARSRDCSCRAAFNAPSRLARWARNSSISCAWPLSSFAACFTSSALRSRKAGKALVLLARQRDLALERLMLAGQFALGGLARLARRVTLGCRGVESLVQRFQLVAQPGGARPLPARFSAPGRIALGHGQIAFGHRRLDSIAQFFKRGCLFSQMPRQVAHPHVEARQARFEPGDGNAAVFGGLGNARFPARQRLVGALCRVELAVLPLNNLMGGCPVRPALPASRRCACRDRQRVARCSAVRAASSPSTAVICDTVRPSLSSASAFAAIKRSDACSVRRISMAAAARTWSRSAATSAIERGSCIWRRRVDRTGSRAARWLAEAQ